MDNFIKLVLALTLFFYLIYWLYLYKTVESTRSSKRALLILIIILSLMVIFQLSQVFNRNIGRLEILDNPLIKILGLAFFLCGIALSIWGKETLGRNWSTAWEYQIKKDHQSIISGPYKLIRHPIYAALFAICLGFELALANILSFVVMVFLPPIIYLQAKREELLLEKRFGKEYKNYRRRTKMFIPLFF